MFEQNKRLIGEDELDYDDDVIYQNDRKRINSASNDIPDDTDFDAETILLDAI